MTQKRNKLRLSCPHCGEFARIRSSEQLTPIYREAVVECQNDDCGWRGNLTLEMTKTLSPSLQPNPDVRLPLSPGLREQLAAESS